MVSVDVLDKAGNYELEAAYYKPSTKANEHAIVQFRRGAYVQETGKNIFYFVSLTLSEFFLKRFSITVLRLLD